MRPSLAAAAQITVSTNVVRRCDDYAGKQRNELCSLCWKCRLLDPSIRAFWPLYKVTSHRITEFREGIRSPPPPPSYLSVLRNLFSPSVTVPNLSFSSFPFFSCSASEWGVGDHLPRGGGYSFAVTRASLDTNCSGVPRMPRVPKT